MKEPTDISVSCRCGKVRGKLRGISSKSCTHLTCMCDDCQAYVKFLGAADVLDDNGGTELTQVGHNQVVIEAGREHLGCVRLSGKGMFRWYAQCCSIPIANTFGAKSVFAGVVHACLREPADGSPLASVIGPLRGRAQAKFGKGELPADASQTASFSLVWWMMRRFVAWALAGASTPSTFFVGGKPCVPPRILSAEERRALG